MMQPLIQLLFQMQVVSFKLVEGTGITLTTTGTTADGIITINATGVNTDSQTIDTFEIVSNILRLSLENDAEPF